MVLTDIHHHAVYGVDDGAPVRAASVQMLRAAAKQGVLRIVCTAHDMPRGRRLDTVRYQRNLDELQKVACQIDPRMELLSGSEVFCTPSTTAELKGGRVLTLAGTKCVLVEFHRAFPWPLMQQALEEIHQLGYTPVIAHAERYACLEDISRLAYLREHFGAIIQINAGTVLQSRQLVKGRWVRCVLRARLVDVVASDAHHDRPCCMAEAHALLKRRYGQEYADSLCRTTPDLLLKAERIND